MEDEFAHFTKNWDVTLQGDVKKMVQKRVCFATASFLINFNNVSQFH